MQNDHAADAAPPSPNVVPFEVPYESLVDAYHTELPRLRKVAKLTPLRKRALAAAWRGDLLGDDVEEWRRFFAYVRTSCPFLTGERPGRDGTTMLVDLEWLTRPENLVRVIEGKYEDAPMEGKIRG